MNRTIADLKKYLDNMEEHGFELVEWQTAVTTTFNGETVILKFGQAQKELAADE